MRFRHPLVATVLVSTGLTMTMVALTAQGSRIQRGAPDIAIEVVSPRDTAAHLKRKVDAYLQGGSKAVWVVFPDSGSVMVHTADSVRELKGNQRVEDPLLPGFSAPVSEFFALPFPDPNAR